MFSGPQSVQGDCTGSTFEKTRYKANTKMLDWLEVSDEAMERVLHYLSFSFWTPACYLLLLLLHLFSFFPFSSSPALNFILSMDSADYTGCVKQRRAGRLRAEALG